MQFARQLSPNAGFTVFLPFDQHFMVSDDVLVGGFKNLALDVLADLNVLALL